MGQARPGRRRGRGVTLVETMIVVSIIGILASMGVPQFQMAIEQSRANIAGANLRAIWTAQRAHWLQNSNTFAVDLATLRADKLLDAALVDDPGDGGTVAAGVVYVYSISQSTASTFQATARRVGPAGTTGTLTIDDTGARRGSVQL